jgi:hypothetical protein
VDEGLFFHCEESVIIINEDPKKPTEHLPEIRA